MRSAVALGGSLAIVLALAHSALAKPARSFDTPEAAVAHFVRSVAADDLEGVMESFAIDEYAAGFDFSTTARDMGSFTPTFLDGPTRYKMYVRINALKVTSEYVNQTMNFVASLLLDDGMLDKLKRSSESSDADTRAVVRALDPAKLRSLKVVRIDQPRRSITSTPKFAELARKQAARQGAEDSTDRIALFKLRGTYYWSGFNLMKYGKTWRIRRLTSFHAEISGPPGRIAARTTPQEYVERTK